MLMRVVQEATQQTLRLLQVFSHSLAPVPADMPISNNRCFTPALLWVRLGSWVWEPALGEPVSTALPLRLRPPLPCWTLPCGSCMLSLHG